MAFTSIFGMQPQAWYSIPMLVLNLKFGIGSEFPRLVSVLFILVSHAWYSINVMVLNHTFCIGCEFLM